MFMSPAFGRLYCDDWTRGSSRLGEFALQAESARECSRFEGAGGLPCCGGVVQWGEIARSLEGRDCRAKSRAF